MIKTILKWISNVLLGLLIIIVVISLISSFKGRKDPEHIPSVLGFKTMPVLTGSMRPVLEPGDMIVIKQIDTKKVKTNDVITYWIGNKLVTHRVVEIVNGNGNTSFRTKGDANNVEDGKLISPDKIVGRLAYNIPKGGYITNFIKSGKGFVLFFILPIVLLLGGEIKKVLFEVIAKKEKNHSDDMEV